MGGTVTLLSYGYWIREKGREGLEGTKACRIDLAVGYAMTAVFGVAMIIIGSQVEVTGKGATVALTLASQLEKVMGPTGRWLFLVGFWGAVFSSLLGVWQAVPYIFSDWWLLVKRRGTGEPDPSIAETIDTASPAYRGYLVALAIVPILGLFWGFQDIQKIYAIIGATFIPLLALALLIMNGRALWVGDGFKNRPATIAVLLATLAFFAWIAVRTAMG